MSIKKLLLLFTVVFIVACEQITETPLGNIDFSITSPKTNWVYYENTKLMLAVNVNTQDVEWTSGISGFLGKGNHITVFLEQGIHTIRAVIQGVAKERQVYVLPMDKNTGTQSILVNYSPLQIKLKSGTYHSYLSTNEGSITNYTLPLEQAKTAPGFMSRVSTTDGLDPLPQRDIRIPLPKTKKQVVRQPPGLRQRTTTERTFTVINTANQSLTPHQIDAKLCYQSDVLSVWIPVSYTADILQADFLETIEKTILPRIAAIFGEHEDINGDGTVAVLFTPTLNEENVAVGFFNPVDFFRKNDDPASESYNPHSNEMDIIYAAIPENDSASSFNAPTVLATIAHELTHAVTFTVKTWNRIKQGDSDAPREDLFLDEGWSHLAENLCGFGVSGGNIRFLERYFGDTSMYSFCGINRNGQEDSAGMRGAITLFLSWLFWESGGITWDIANPVEVIDTGGISFLRRMLLAPDIGWESIGTAFGKPVSILFNRMLEEINYYRADNKTFLYQIDPLTGEAVDFFVNMGVVHAENAASDSTIGFPKPQALSSPGNLLPWSVLYFEPFSIPADGIITMYNDKSEGSVYFAALAD